MKAQTFPDDMRSPKQLPTFFPSASSGRVAACAAVLFGSLLAYLFRVAVRLNVDYFDSFEMLMNGRAVLVGNGASYTTHRAPLMGALYAIVEFLMRRFHGDLIAFRVSHVASVCCYGLLCICVYPLLRRSLDAAPALWGAAGLALNGLLIHFAPTFNSDIPGTLLITGAFCLYLRAGSSACLAELLLPALLIGLAGAQRYNLLPLSLAVVGIYEVAGLRFWRMGRWMRVARMLILLSVPLAVMLGITSLVYSRVGHSTLWGATQQFLLDYRGSAYENIQKYQGESPLLAYEFVFCSLSPPIVFCGLLGMAVAYRGAPQTRFFTSCGWESSSWYTPI